jgi:TonB-linked SusC/RagA family outer membrane protein
MNKYIAEVNLSYSGSDNYAPGKRYGLFPAISGAWIVSNESFLSSSAVVNFLKLRASYGVVGNNRIGSLGRWPFFEYYTGVNGNYRIGGSTLNVNETTLEPTSVPNPDATWEKAYKTNLGIDAQLFNKLSLSADYFFETREDIFVNPSNYLSVLIGSRYSYLNLGSAKNSGYEVELTYSNSGSNLSYYASTRLSHVKSEIIDAKESPKTETYLYQKGQPINQPFVLEAIGFITEADVLAIEAGTQAFPTFGTVKPGDVKYKDQNNDLLIDNNDVIPTGNAFPTLLYSFDFGVAWKRFDVSVFMYGVSGRTISLLDNQIVPLLDNVMPTQWVKDNYWTPERGDAAKFPRLTTESNPNNYRASTLWQRDGSSLRVKNIELGYTIPQTQKLGMRIYLNAVNPFIFHKITEMEIDPEINNSFLYPQMKSYNIGVKLTF